MRNALVASVIVAAALPLLAHAQNQSGTDKVPATVNLGGGSNWRGEVPKGPVPRLPDGTVDLSGVWQGGGPGGSNGNLARGLPKGETIPILPWAKAKMEARTAIDNSEAFCLPAGVPRVPSNY